jgi:hypothetical protein
MRFLQGSKAIHLLLVIAGISGMVARAATPALAADDFGLAGLNGSWIINTAETRKYHAVEDLGHVSPHLLIRMDGDKKRFEIGREDDMMFGLPITIIKVERLDAETVVHLEDSSAYAMSLLTPDRLVCSTENGFLPPYAVVFDRHAENASIPSVTALQGAWVFSLERTLAQYRTSSGREWGRLRESMGSRTAGMSVDIAVVGKNIVSITFHNNGYIMQGPEDAAIALEENRWGILEGERAPEGRASRIRMVILDDLLYYHDGYNEGDFVFERK